MKKFFVVLMTVILTMLLVSKPSFASSKKVLITEVQAGGSTSSSEEFIEIYSSNDADIDITGWSFYYKSATGLTWAKKATVLSGILKPKNFWVFSANLAGNTTFSSGLSGTGGNIQIRDKLGNIIDQFGWGNANAALVSPASISAGGQSMYRVYNFDSGTFQNTDNNFADFDIAEEPTPAKVPSLEVADIDTEPVVYPDLELSELLPDPNSPLIDSSDEFIEIYNPTAKDVDLTGWALKDESGSTYLIKNQLIVAGARLAIFSRDSKITLNNTGDAIQLIDPNGKIRDESINYGNAEPGLSWSKISGVWQWAVAPTPDTDNSDAYTVDILNTTKAVAKVKKATTKKATNKTTMPKSTKKPTTSKTNSANKGGVLNKIDSSPKSSNVWWAWLLVAAGVATMGYAIYEYRTEIQLFIKKLRRHQ